MPTDELLQEAMLAHRAGRLAAAEVGYRRVLRSRPDEPRALHFLGLIHFHRGDVRLGLQHVEQALRGDAGNARRWNDYGGMLISTGRRSEAADAYRRATEVAPSIPEGWYNLGICLRDAGELTHASESLRQAIRADAAYSRAYEALAMLLYQLGQMQEAADVYATWAAHDPANATARHMAAAGSGRDVPSRASDDFVRAHFDSAAATFDANLEQLQYRAPAIVIEALRAAAHELEAVLDAGCGTGLCGPLLRDLSATLVGVDLSERMVERARARECYDELHVGELTAFMRSRASAFDAVVSADTFVYFGDLDEPLNAACHALKPGGLCVFTLEADGDADADVDHRLGPHGRYLHSEPYVRWVLESAGFERVSLTQVTLRQERDHNVAGFCVVARKGTARASINDQTSAPSTGSPAESTSE